MFKVFLIFLILSIFKLNFAQIPTTSTSSPFNVPTTTISGANQAPPTTTIQIGKCSYNADLEIDAVVVRNQTAGSFGQCCSMCLSDPQCVAWTFVVQTNECQIKKDLPVTRSTITRNYYGVYSGFGYQYQYYPQYQYQFPYQYYAPVYSYGYGSSYGYPSNYGYAGYGGQYGGSGYGGYGGYGGYPYGYGK